jgi:mono/diheme cytochrome c family protein
MADAARPPRHRHVRRYLAVGGLGLLAVLLVIQLVPYGRDHSNPAPTMQVALATAAQRELFRNSCQDCHSSQTEWLWYANVAPVSWLVQSDVQGGREHMNLSAWDTAQPALDDVIEQIQGGEMPPLKYWVSPSHWHARLSDADKRRLIAGFPELHRLHPPRTGGGG